MTRTLTVPSDSDPNKTYDVTIHDDGQVTCTCWGYRRWEHCKHSDPHRNQPDAPTQDRWVSVERRDRQAANGSRWESHRYDCPEGRKHRLHMGMYMLDRPHPQPKHPVPGCCAKGRP